MRTWIPKLFDKKTSCSVVFLSKRLLQHLKSEVRVITFYLRKQFSFLTKLSSADWTKCKFVCFYGIPTWRRCDIVFCTKNWTRLTVNFEKEWMEKKPTCLVVLRYKHIRFTCLLVSVWRELYYSSLKYANLGKRESVHSSHIPQLGYLAIFLI